MDAGGNGLTLNANNITIQSNYIGLMLDGVTRSGNSGHGMLITANSRDNLIGAFIDPVTGLIVDSSFSNIISGNGSSGIFLEGTNTNTISGNNISVTGDGNRGILVTESRANSPSINDLRILDNKIAANGAQTAAIEAVVSNGYLANLEIAGNQVSTDGAFLSHGIRVLASETGSIGVSTINDNDILTSGPLSEGVYLSSLDGASIGQVTVNNNIVTTTGDVGSDSRNQYDLESDGIYVNALRDGRLYKVNISGNEVTTYGNDADGIYLIAGVNGVVSQALLSNNTVSALASNPVQSNQASEGIKILSYADSLIRITLYENLIIQSEATGILLKTQSGIRPNDGGSIFADVQDNAVISANPSGQIDATAYGASNPDNVGTITLVGESLEDVLSSNTPSDRAAYYATGEILFVPSVNARSIETGIPTTISNGNEGMISSRFEDHSWVTADGAVHVMANTNGQLSLYSSDNNGMAWNKSVTLGSSSSSSRGDGLIYNDKLYEVYTTGSGSTALSILDYSEANVSWSISSTVVLPNPPSLKLERPSIAITPDGTLWVCCTATDEVTGDVSLRVFSSADDGQTWTLINERIDNTIDNPSGIKPQLQGGKGRMSGNIMATKDGVSLLYTNGNTLNWVDYSLSGASSGTYENKRLLVYGTSQKDPDGTHFSSVTDSQGNIHVATNNGNSRVVYLRYDSATDTWDAPVEITSYRSGSYMQISLLADGRIYITYEVSGGSYLEVSESTDGGNTWGVNSRLTQDVVSDPGNARVETPAYAQGTLPVFQQVDNLDGTSSLVYYEVA
jgi:hypothetical protein